MCVAFIAGRQPVTRHEGCASYHQGGSLAASLRVQAPMQLLHQDKECCCEQDIDAAQPSSAACLLLCPLWCHIALQVGHCSGIGCCEQVEAWECGDFGVPVLKVFSAVALRLRDVKPLVLQSRRAPG